MKTYIKSSIQIDYIQLNGLIEDVLMDYLDDVDSFYENEIGEIIQEQVVFIIEELDEDGVYSDYLPYTHNPEFLDHINKQVELLLDEMM